MPHLPATGRLKPTFAPQKRAHSQEWLCYGLVVAGAVQHFDGVR